MLETPQERVELLKAGITGKKIEELYIIYNSFKIVRSPMFFKMVEINIEENQNTIASQEAATGYTEV